MFKKHPILLGTFILTATGFISRFIGFFFRMFLSHVFGEEQVGLYQLIFPIYAFCFSFTTAGIETALSRCIAHKLSSNKHSEIKQLITSAITISLLLSFLAVVTLQHYAFDLSIYVLGDIRCQSMLIAMSYAIPFAAIHSCVCGFYFGLKETKIPAISQIIEQLFRVGSVYILYKITLYQNGQLNILFAVIGLVAGEFFSALFCMQRFTKDIKSYTSNSSSQKFITLTKELLHLSIPLTASRMLLNFLQSIESISIPLQLQAYGYTNSEALRNYGVLTGMALPCIFFPTAITNSISTMLLPTAAELQAKKDYPSLKKLISKICFSCVMMGSFCCIIFFTASNWIGKLLFHSILAGTYLKILSWICPFLYLNATLLSIINGLGKTNISLIINSISLLIRILGIIIFIPQIGMNGYLWGLLFSHCVTSIFAFFYISLHLKKIAS